jgi:hypothetical protein
MSFKPPHPTLKHARPISLYLGDGQRNEHYLQSMRFIFVHLGAE